MKVAYLSWPPLFNADVSLVSELYNYADVHYFIEVSPRYSNGAGISINKICRKIGIFKAVELYSEFNCFKDILDLDKVYVMNSYGRFWIFGSWYNNLVLKRRIKKEKFDVVHTTNPYNVYQLGLYKFRKKTVVTFHDPFPHSGESSKVNTFRRKKAIKELENYILLNGEQKERFKQFYNLGPEKNIFLSRLGSYSFMKDIYQSSPKSQKEKSILFFGRISPYKGVDYLLKAFTQKQKELKGFKLVIAGGGDYYFDVTPYQNNPNIEFIHKYIPENELANLIADCLFCVCPYTDATQSGVIMSAFAFNKTVIATEVGSLPQMLGNGKYGRIISPKDEKSLGEALLELANNVELRKKYEDAIKGDYLEGEYSWKTIAKQTFEYYKQIAIKKK